MNAFVIKKKLFFGFLLMILMAVIYIVLTATRKPVTPAYISQVMPTTKLVECIIVTPSIQEATPEPTVKSVKKPIIISPAETP